MNELKGQLCAFMKIKSNKGYIKKPIITCFK